MNAIEVGKILPKVGSVAAVNIFHEYYNATQKEIKYITFSYVPYNSVNDMVACTASGKTEVSGKLTGPIPPKHKSYVEWENMWFNPTVTKVVLTKIHVQYMDNTEEVIEGKDIVFMEDHNSKYYKEIGQKEEEERARKDAEYAKNKKIESTRKALHENWSTSGRESFSLDMFADFKNDEEALLKIFDNTKIYYSTGYAIGDYLEKEYSSNDKLMKKAISFWKESVAQQQKYYNTPFAKEHPDFPQKYSAKIQKYEPAYVMPKKAGCVSFG